jgi:ABC-type dipeptide/oligopeptide/nickel transport system permease subunit
MATGVTTVQAPVAEWSQTIEQRHRLATLGRTARRNPVGVIAAIVVLAFVVLGVTEVISHSVFGTTVAPYNPSEIRASDQLQGPSLAHPLGTNQRGNDMLSRILAGARVSFLIGVMALGFGFIPGALLGVMSGYYQRWIDYLIQRSSEAWAAFPVLFLYLAFITALGQGLKTIAIVIIISSLFGGSRVLRAAALITKHSDYIEASRSLGASDNWILTKHLIPNVMPIIIVGASSVFAVSVLLESALSFLGLGLQPGTPSWGIDLSEGQTSNMRLHPYLVIFPGMAISLVVLGFNLLGDTLRDVLDPRLRGSLR